jgi:Leucine-rich repeat (LRR) protein
VQLHLPDDQPSSNRVQPRIRAFRPGVLHHLKGRGPWAVPMESQIEGVDILGHTINATLLYHMTTQDPLFHASIEAIQRAAIENLKSLDLSLFALRQIPPEIGKLKHLESLRVSSKNLKEIPKEIGELQQLKSLEITSCKLTSLPEEIGQLSLLRSVKLNSNQFEEFPLGICNLTSLVYFDISSN